MAKQLYQNDQRWKDEKIGLQDNLTIEQVGCLLTGMAMIVNHFGANETPLSLNNRMKAGDGFNGAWLKAAQVPGKFPALGVKRQKRVVCEDKPAPLDLIDAGLARDSLVIVRVDWTPDANIDSHWVVIHAKAGDDYLIWDPWQKKGAPDTLMGRYGFAGKTAADVILEAIWHGKADLEATEEETADDAPPAAADEAPPEDTPVAATEPVFVQPTVALTFRRQPETGAAIRILATDETLTALEAGAGEKVGRQGAWLQAADAAGERGYVAAWLVRQTAVSPERPKKAPVAPRSPSSSTVRTTADSLSFRARPVVSDETLICYLPAGTSLTLLEESDRAAIGQQGKWLHVRDAEGRQGYVAAWYVQAG